MGVQEQPQHLTGILIDLFSHSRTFAHFQVQTKQYCSKMMCGMHAKGFKATSTSNRASNFSGFLISIKMVTLQKMIGKKTSNLTATNS